jgi:hypothetical protein
MLQVAENSDIFAAEYLSGVIAAMLQKLLAALNERTEWGQVIIIDTLETLAKPKASSSVTPPPVCSTPTLPLSCPPSKSPWVTSNL